MVSREDQAAGLRSRCAPRLRVIAVTSGKGGVGKSNLAANVAVLAARAGRRVLLIDGDLGLANAEILLGVRPAKDIGALFEGAALEDILAQGPEGLRLLSAGRDADRLARLDAEQRAQLFAALDELENRFDLVLVDTGAGVGENVVFFAGATEEAILVVSPEPTALADAYAAVKVLSAAGTHRFKVVVSQVSNEAAGRQVFGRLTQVTSRFLKASLTYVGCVPTDQNLRRAVMWQRPVVELFPYSPASKAYEGIAADLLSGEQPSHVPGGSRFLWNRLLRQSMESVS